MGKIAVQKVASAFLTDATPARAMRVSSINAPRNFVKSRKYQSVRITSTTARQRKSGAMKRRNSAARKRS